MATTFPKEKIRVLFLENISNAAVRIFNDSGYHQVLQLSGALSEVELIKALKGVHILGIRSKTHISERVLQNATSLQAIGCFCIGTNQVDMRAAKAHGVAVFNAPYSNTRSVAELVIGLSIMLMRRVVDKNNAAHAGIWMKDASGSFELRGKTIGILGYGNIGAQVSVLAESLGMRVIFYDIETKLPLGNATAAKSLRDMVRQSDIVSLHIPANELTTNIIDKHTLKFFKKGAVLINCARGEVMHPQDAANALLQGRLAGIATDVFPVEPEKNGDAFSSPLQGLPNVILTPHIGGSTVEAQQNIGIDVANKLLQYLERGVSFGSLSVPALSLPAVGGAHRILHIHHNVPGVLSAINTQLSLLGHNIVAQYLKTNEEVGYVVLDVEKRLNKQAIEAITNIEATIKMRLLY
jgi:D-3-phosphoglycerate dehydrogenase